MERPEDGDESDEHQRDSMEGDMVQFQDSTGLDSMLPSSSAPLKPRGLSLDSAGLEDFAFMASNGSSFHQLARARTTLLRPVPELEPLWESSRPMDVDPLSSPQPESLFLPLHGVESGLGKDGGAMDTDDPLFDADSQGSELPDLFDGTSCGFSPLVPDASDEMFEVMSDGTISPALLGPPAPSDGLGLFIFEGQVDIASSELPEDEYQLLRAYYDSVQQAEAARERENALDRRVKDISALLDPSKVVSDPMVMYTWRQELRTASEMQTETRKAKSYGSGVLTTVRESARIRSMGSKSDEEAARQGWSQHHDVLSMFRSLQGDGGGEEERCGGRKVSLCLRSHPGPQVLPEPAHPGHQDLYRSASPEAPALTGHNDLTEISLTGGSSPYGAQDPCGVSLTGGSSPNGAQRPHRGQPPPEVPALTGHDNSYRFSLTEAYPRLNASLPHRAYAVTRPKWPSRQSSSPQYPGQNGLPLVQRVKGDCPSVK
ncbi:hypothetical protein BC835DRAFT_1306383 [Cytidiella melzeri]|nr:hypothetical protein BC835DRAFT_1306383 [Cytidiella melzeri]